MTTRRLVCAALVLALTFPVTACAAAPRGAPARPPESSPAAAYPPPRPDSIEGVSPAPAAAAPPATASPDEVAQAGLRVMYTWDTARDSGPATATRRAVAYLAPPMSTDVIAAPPVASPGAQWADWAAHRAQLTPTVTPGRDDAPPATATRIYRQYVITQQVRGADGWTSPPQQTIAFVTLIRTPAGWRIADVRT